MFRNLLRLVVSILICQGAGALGAVFTAPVTKSTWYINLNKPFFQPPNWLFGPVWISLYLMMGIALFLLWQHGPRPFSAAVWWFFAVQLVLNTLWSALFFGLKSPGMALLEIVLLWFAILLTILPLQSISKPAFWLMVPYLVWVGFASLLNGAIWWLNRSAG